MGNRLKAVFIALSFCVVAACSGGDTEQASAKPEKAAAQPKKVEAVKLEKKSRNPYKTQINVMNKAKDLKKDLNAKTQASTDEINKLMGK